MDQQKLDLARTSIPLRLGPDAGTLASQRLGQSSGFALGPDDEKALISKRHWLRRSRIMLIGQAALIPRYFAA